VGYISYGERMVRGMYEIQKIEKTYAAAAEAVVRILMDLEVTADQLSCCDLSYQIIEKLGWKK